MYFHENHPFSLFVEHILPVGELKRSLLHSSVSFLRAPLLPGPSKDQVDFALVFPILYPPLSLPGPWLP